MKFEKPALWTNLSLLIVFVLVFGVFEWVGIGFSLTFTGLIDLLLGVFWLLSNKKTLAQSYLLAAALLLLFGYGICSATGPL